MYLKPSEIRYSQDSINNHFDKNCSHSNKRIGETLDDLITGRCSMSDIPTITVVKKNGNWTSSDNRRLWVFKKFEELKGCSGISVNVSSHIPFNKCTSYNGGVSIQVRRDAGGRIWRQMTPKVNVSNDSAVNRPSSVGTGVLHFSSSYTARPSMAREREMTVQNTLFRGPVSSPMDTYQSSRPSYRTLSTVYPETFRSVGFYASHNVSHQVNIKRLNPEDVRYTKEKIRLRQSDLHVPLSKDPINVYKAFGECWAIDGNETLYIYKREKISNPFVTIPAKVSEDKEEFLEKMREDKPGLSLIEILQMGENIDVEF